MIILFLTPKFQLCTARTWSAGLVMSWQQRRSLLERLSGVDPGGKNNAVQLANIAAEIGLSIEQVAVESYP